MQPNPVIFTPLLIAACTLFVWSCYRRFSLVAVGLPEDRCSGLAARLRGTFLFAFLQKRVVSRPFGINHLLIFWSFLILVLANTEFLLGGVFPAARLSLLPAFLYHPLLTAFDLVSLSALVAVSAAALRRVFTPPYQGARTSEAFAILAMIGVLMLAYFGLHGAEIALGTEPAAAAMPVSSALARLLAGPAAGAPLGTVAACSWWLHAAVLLSFLNYLPYSKHMHILAAIPNCYFKGLDTRQVPSREEFAEGNVFGAGSIDRLTWKDLFDSFSCTECGRCQKECPASATGKPLNPRLVMHQIKENLLANGPLLQRGGEPTVPLIGAEEGSIDKNAIWSCTTCGACLAACPVFIEQMPKLIKMRRHLVQMDADFPEELLNLF